MVGGCRAWWRGLGNNGSVRKTWLPPTIFLFSVHLRSDCPVEYYTVVSKHEDQFTYPLMWKNHQDSLSKATEECVVDQNPSPGPRVTKGQGRSSPFYKMEGCLLSPTILPHTLSHCTCSGPQTCTWSPCHPRHCFQSNTWQKASNISGERAFQRRPLNALSRFFYLLYCLITDRLIDRLIYYLTI